MTLEAKILRDDSLRRTSEGYEIAVHLAWYRSLPLSCLESAAIEVAATRFTPEQVRVLHNGKALSFQELEPLVDEWWFVQDPLTLQILTETTLEAGSRTTLSVDLATRVPYIVIGPNMALVQRSAVSREVTVR